jgi:hypothetical protein
MVLIRTQAHQFVNQRNALQAFTVSTVFKLLVEQVNIQKWVRVSNPIALLNCAVMDMYVSLVCEACVRMEVIRMLEIALALHVRKDIIA